MDILNIVFGVATLIALCIAIYEWKRNRESARKLKELEDGLVLHSFKLKKGMEYYQEGNYASALEAFRAFAKESDDSAEMFGVIRKIFWSETKKIFGFTIGNGSGWSPEMIALLAMRVDKSEETAYPDYIIKLIDIYESTYNKSATCYKAIVLLVNSDYENVENQISFEMIKPTPSKSANDSFRKGIVAFCKYKKSTNV